MARKNRPDGIKNWVGTYVAELRNQMGWSQNDLAVKLQNAGVDITKNAIQLLEHGHRYVRDMELFALAKVFGRPMETFFPKSPQERGE